MEIRKSTIDDLPRMLAIYARAREFMVGAGNPRQWAANGWPPEALLRSDIADGNSYVAIEDGEIVATFFYKYGKLAEPGYEDIEDGQWIGDNTYGVLHRLAVSGTVRGAGPRCLAWVYDQCGHVRADTHPDNQPMQGVFRKLGFTYCGIIHVEEDDDPRYAYEKL